MDGTELLRAELPDPRLEDPSAYLRWCYRQNPLGAAWERYHYDDGPDGAPLLVAHYVNIPRLYRGPQGVLCDGAWSQNAVTRSGHQRARHFTRLGLEIYDEAGAAGRAFVVGVTNHRSTGPVVKYMGWRLVGPLPVRVVPPVWVGVGRGRRAGARGLSHTPVDERWLASEDFEHFAALVDRHPVGGWCTRWTADVLRWRLGCPFTNYRVHQTPDLAVVSTKTRYARMPATVILKLFPLAAAEEDHAAVDSGSGRRLDATGVVSAIARADRSLFAVYAGFNGSVRVRGVAPPRRLQPSPLNLIIRGLDGSVHQDDVVLDTFEFLDMDAF